MPKHGGFGYEWDCTPETCREHWPSGAVALTEPCQHNTILRHWATDESEIGYWVCEGCGKQFDFVLMPGPQTMEAYKELTPEQRERLKDLPCHTALASREAPKPIKHICGASGYNPALGDSCPACASREGAK